MALAADLLSCRGLNVGIAGRSFCRDLFLRVRPGECLAILGRNGAGKSTLLSVLAGLRAPLAGEVLIDGSSYAKLGPRASARLRGWLPQNRNEAFSSTVLETALVGRHPHLARWDWESEGDVGIASRALIAVGLGELAQRDVQTLSGGELQRLAIATLLTQAPRLYLLDEPLAHLDLNHQIAVLDLFAGAAADCGAGVIMVLHEPGLADRYCERALLVYGDGRCELGSCRELLTADRLGELYGHPLQEVEADGRRWFIPA